jgi:hypothetical protein
VTGSAALEQQVRSVPGVVACAVDDADIVHVLVGFGVRPERVAAAVADVVGPTHHVRIAGAPPRARGWRPVMGDLVPVFGAVVAATVLAAGGAAAFGHVVDGDRRTGGVPVVATQGAVEAADVRTAQAAPEVAPPVEAERQEVLGEVVEAPPPPAP